jgi:hypothetical protein
MNGLRAGQKRRGAVRDSLLGSRSVCRLVAPGVIATSVEQIGCAEFERGQINTIRKTYDDATTFRRREDVDDEARGLR